MSDIEVRVMLYRDGGVTAVLEADGCALWTSTERSDAAAAVLELAYQLGELLVHRGELLGKAMDMLGELGSSPMLRGSVGGADAMALAAEIDASMDGALPTSSRCTCDGGPYSVAPPFPSRHCPVHGAQYSAEAALRQELYSGKQVGPRGD